MKYLFVFLALGALAYTSYGAPANSNIQQDDSDPTNEKEFLDLISRVAKTSQSDEDDDTSAEAQYWGSLFRVLGKPLIRHVGGLVAHKIFSGGKSDKEFLNRVAKVSQSDDDDDIPAEAQWRGFGKLFRKLRRNKKVRKLAGKIIGGMIGSYMNPQQDNGGEENALIEDDDMAEAENDALVQAFLEKLMEKDSEMKAAIESLPEEARSQFLFSVGLPLLAGLLHSRG